MRADSSSSFSLISHYQTWLVKRWRRFQPITRFLEFNLYAFPHLYMVAHLLLGMELVTYRGFTFRYLYLDSRVVMLIALVSFGLIFAQRLSHKVALPPITTLTLELNKLIIVPLLLIQYLFISLDMYYYPNYVYSKFHLNTSNVQLIVSFNILILFLQLAQHSQKVAQFIWSRVAHKGTVNIIFIGAVAFFFFPNSQQILEWMYEAGIRIVRTASLSWEDRFIYLNGGEASTGWVLHYTQFVNHHVPKDATIFIPPQKEAWQMEGNLYYIRWYLYPRQLVTSQDLDAPIPEEANYVLIDDGAWPGMTEYGWPRIFIPAEKIVKMVFIDRESKQESMITGKDYDPELYSHKWGVIQLRK